MPQRLTLSVRQPFADEILAGTKTFEFRDYPTKVRGTVLLYASKTECPKGMDCGVILGAVEIVDCLGEMLEDGPIYGWVLENPRRFKRPIRLFTGSPQPSFWKASY
jgi:predicted transcriptional regulator